MKRYELVIIWLPENEKQVDEFSTKEEAEIAKRRMEMAFGNQLWACVREKRG